MTPEAPVERRPRLHPCRIPIQIPITIDAIVDVPTSSIVGQIAFAISVETGWLSQVNPRFPWAVCLR